MIPSLQESVPGQLTTSVISSAPAVAEVQCHEALPDVVHSLVADPAQHQVLVGGGAGVAAGVVAHDLAEATQLLRRHIAARDRDLDGREPAWRWRWTLL